MKEHREQFMRIAMALLKKQFPNTQQRLAICAKLWTRHLKKQQHNALVDVIRISEENGLYDKPSNAKN